MRHTPGPWSIIGSIIPGDKHPIIEAAEFGAVCAISLRGAPRNQDRLPADSLYHQPEIPTAEANAHLIAAAPDLLEACKQTWHYIHACKRPGDGDRDNPSYTINIVEKCLSAAIAKAEGGKQC